MNQPQDKSLVSVIIPTYNRAALIGRAIESALRQDYANKEIIVVDDGSTDNTAAVVGAYADVRYLYRANGGQAAARSTGLEAAKGAFIASLDSDDVWEPDFLRQSITSIEEHRLDFVFANWYQQTPDGRMEDYFAGFKFLRPWWNSRPESPMLFNYPELRNLYLECCPSPSSAVVIRRSSFVGAWNEKMNMADDWCLLLDIVLSKEARVALIREKLWHKSINTNNIYDGREYYEVLEGMYIEDTREMLRRHSSRLTRDEQRVMEHRCIDCSYQLLKLSFMMRAHYGGSFWKWLQAFWLNPIMFIKLGWEKLRK